MRQKQKKKSKLTQHSEALIKRVKNYENSQELSRLLKSTASHEMRTATAIQHKENVAVDEKTLIFFVR